MENTKVKLADNYVMCNDDKTCLVKVTCKLHICTFRMHASLVSHGI